ncbi:hypothetical protein SLE2022_278230 [Rubroshorea leprosula]
MKFGKEFKTHLEETLPEWRDKFLCYKPLKKLLKNLPSNPTPDPRPHFADTTNTSAAVYPLPHQQDHGGSHLRIPLQDWFVKILNEELEKFNDFYVDKEEDFVIRFQELKERIQQVKETSGRGGVFTSESEFSEEMMDMRKDLVIIHGEMVLLKNYSALNFAGLIKILKKYDKRTGGLLRLPFTQIALHQPFFTTESLTRLVRECEENLELLFPLEAEVIQSTTAVQGLSNSTSNVSVDASSTLVGEGTMDVYRSTLAAIEAIRGLQKSSSTCNPLSFSSLLRGQGNDSEGALTAENSAINSSATQQNDKEGDKEDAQSVSKNP